MTQYGISNDQLVNHGAINNDMRKNHIVFLSQINISEFWNLPPNMVSSWDCGFELNSYLIPLSYFLWSELFFSLSWNKSVGVDVCLGVGWIGADG